MAYAVITRDRDGTAPYAEALRAQGLESVAMPVTRTEPMHGNVDAALDRGGHDTIACASTRAALALATVGGGRTLPAVWVVGAATASVLVEAGIATRHEPGVRDGASLARAIIAAGPVRGMRILVPRAEGGREELIEMLEAAGAIVDPVVAYRTIWTPAGDTELVAGRELLAADRAAVCALFAPSQVRALDALVGVRTIDTLFAAIGETTAQALREDGARRIAVAAEPTPEGLAKAIAAVYPTKR